MYPKMRDLEMIFNLLWTTKSQVNDHERASIVGMCDVPSTTLNWETFKSYLLKNSGSNAADVKVSYIDFNDKDVYINSQTEFQLALYTFRRRARVGEVITLKLERIEPKCVTFRELGIQSVVTHKELFKSEKLEEETPPKWFFNYMKNHEKNLISEVTQVVSSLINAKLSGNCPHLHPTRKNKGESYKRSRKIATNLELSKAILDSKLDTVKSSDKLEHKKLKSKKLSINKVSSDSDAGRVTSPNTSKRIVYGLPINGGEIDVSVIGNTQTKLPPMYGGEVYYQWWDIANTGQTPWNDKTLLIYAWGSKELCPMNTVVSCPPLQPGDKGQVNITLKMPDEPGVYECYWHFHHMGRRFGHWLSCQVEVIERPVLSFLTSPAVSRFDDLQVSTVDSTAKTSCTVTSATAVASVATEIKVDNKVDMDGSESDNVSIISISECNSDNCYVVGGGKINNEKVEKGDCSPKYNNLDRLLMYQEQQPQQQQQQQQQSEDDLQYFYVTHKDVEDASVVENTIQACDKSSSQEESSEYENINVGNEEATVNSSLKNEEQQQPRTSSSSASSSSPSSSTSFFSTLEKSHSAGGDNQKRLFVFPRHSPGFEVVFPTKTQAEAIDDDDGYSSTTRKSAEGASAPPQAASATSESFSSNGNNQQFRSEKLDRKMSVANAISEAAIYASNVMSKTRNIADVVKSARSGKWVQGHWVSENENSKRENNLKLLAEMGFVDRDLNATLLARYKDDINVVISELLK